MSAAAGGQNASSSAAAGRRIFFAPEAEQREFSFVKPLGSEDYVNSGIPVENKSTKPYAGHIAMNNARKDPELREFLTATQANYYNAYQRSLASLRAGENVVPKYNFSPKHRTQYNKLIQAMFVIQKHLQKEEAKKANKESRGETYEIPNEESIRDSYERLIEKIAKYGEIMAQAAAEQGALNELAAAQVAEEAANSGAYSYSPPGGNNLYSGGRRKNTRKNKGKKRKTMRRRR